MASDEAATRDYYRSLSGKRIGAGLICRDIDGRVLRVQPIRKPTCKIPGGVRDLRRWLDQNTGAS